MWLAWAAAAGALLTKGLLALVLPALTLIAYSIVQRHWSIWRRLPIAKRPRAVPVADLPWMLPCSAQCHSSSTFFIVREHFARYLTMVSGRYQPWWFFSGYSSRALCRGRYPAVRALLTGWRRSSARRLRCATVPLDLSVTVLVFFSASDSKLVPYIPPMFPSVAVLMATIEETRLGVAICARQAYCSW